MTLKHASRHSPISAAPPAVSENPSARSSAFAEENKKCLLDRSSVTAALADYLLQVNYRGYAPNPSLVLAIRRGDRTAWLRRAELPVRWETYYFIEGELFPIPGTTRLPEGKSPAEHAEDIVARIWPQLWVWNGYDFTPSSSALNRNAYKNTYMEPARRET
ncbi:MAG: hypothetical protein LBO79_05520 [Zoogloeaceae bacterium]|jgi:hypothetical protein|nr:hypothetical protein [Zoogloeaceae bacterium]